MFWSNKVLVKRKFCSNACNKFGLKSLDKIGSVTGEIFLIWANVAKTNVSWTNVTGKLASVKGGPRNLPLKFGLNMVSIS